MTTRAFWTFADNFYINAIGTNYTKALKISKYHFDALTAKQADPGIAALLADFTPVHDALVDAEAAKGVDLGQRAGKTLSVQQLLKKMIETDLPNVQTQIRVVYGPKTPEYKALFPQGNKPFETGTIDNRILAAQILRDACAADPALAAVAASIAAGYTILDDARNAQLGEKTDVGGDIETEKDAITDMCEIHFKNHGKLIGLYWDDPDRIASFTDVTTLQSHTHDQVYIGSVHPLKTKKVLTHTFNPSSKVMITNTSLADLNFYIVDRANNPIHPSGVTVAAGAIQEVDVADLGNDEDRILMVHDVDASTPGSYEVTVEDTP